MAGLKEKRNRKKRSTGDPAQSVDVQFTATKIKPVGGGFVIPPNTIDFK